VATFKKVIELSPNSIDGWSGLAEALSRTGRLGLAEAAHKKVLQLDPQNERSPSALGQLYITQQRYQEAENLLLSLAASAPKREGATAYLLNELYRKIGDTDAAQKWSEKIPQPPAEVLKAQQKRRERSFSFTARDDAKFRMDRERDKLPFPEKASDETLQAWALFKSNYRGEARDLFRRLTTQNTQNADAWNGLGWDVLLNAWLEVEDKTYSIRGGQRNQKSDKNAQRRADDVQDQLQTAKEHFDRALEIDPASTIAADGAARTLQLQGDMPGAIKVWEELVASYPSYQPGLANLADAYLEQNETAKAIPVLEKLAKLRPRDKELRAKVTQVSETAKGLDTNSTMTLD
jgi:tetratricopeptide (TPR) repeat protein